MPKIPLCKNCACKCSSHPKYWFSLWPISIKYYKWFLWYGRPTKGVKPYFEQGALSKILTIANSRHEQAGFNTQRVQQVKFRSTGNPYIVAPNDTVTTNEYGSQINK